MVDANIHQGELDALVVMQALDEGECGEGGSDGEDGVAVRPEEALCWGEASVGLGEGVGEGLF